MQEKSTAFIFPGQGSQALGMGLSLAQTFDVARKTFTQADSWIGFSLSKIAWEGPEDELNDTINTQPALLVHTIAAWEVFREKYPGFVPVLVAGHSMGELSALVVSGAASFEDTLKLVRRRGELMKQAGESAPGGMAAVLGMDAADLEGICAEASDINEIVQVANDNCPGQVVISGSNIALERAIQLAQQRGARRVRKLAVSIAAHSPLMGVSQKDFTLAVGQAPLQDPAIPIIGNVTARPLKTAAEIRQDLSLQLTSRVRWTETIQGMVAQGIETFIELGSGDVLTGLLKRIAPQVRGISLCAAQDFNQLDQM